MAEQRIPITRQGGVVIGYEVTVYRQEFCRSEDGGWYGSGCGTGHPYPDWKSASATFRKALKSGSCNAAIHAIVIPERLWP